MRTFEIRISSDHPDAVEIVKEAGEKIACQIDWGDDQTATIEVVETFGRNDPDLLQLWDFVPGTL